MARKQIIHFTPLQRETLSAATRRTTEKYRIVERANILLKYEQSPNKKALKRELNLDVNTIRKWTTRWIEAQPDLLTAEEAIEKAEDQERAKRLYQQAVLHVLEDAFRSGTPPKFSAEQVTCIVAIGCEVLDDSEEGVSYRTHKEIATEAVNRGIVESISSSRVGSFLKSGSDQAA